MKVTMTPIPRSPRFNLILCKTQSVENINFWEVYFGPPQASKLPRGEGSKYQNPLIMEVDFRSHYASLTFTLSPSTYRGEF